MKNIQQYIIKDGKLNLYLGCFVLFIGIVIQFFSVSSVNKYFEFVFKCVGCE